jgi:hypothetical protein
MQAVGRIVEIVTAKAWMRSRVSLPFVDAARVVGFEG